MLQPVHDDAPGEMQESLAPTDILKFLYFHDNIRMVLCIVRHQVLYSTTSMSVRKTKHPFHLAFAPPIPFQPFRKT